MVHPEDLENTKKIIQKHLEGKTDIYQAEFRMKCGDNRYRWIRDLGKVFLRDKNGNPIRMNGVHIDITESKNLELEIKKLSITDGLTGLLNRRYFEKYFNKIMFESKRDKKDVSFLMIDIDFFKEYNDTYGHQMGDDALIKISNSLKSLLHRNDDYCFRLGGEEFGIIFKINKKEEAISFANKIKNEIENLKIEHKKSKISNYLTISLGLYCNKPKEIKNLDYIYKEADSLLYKAKEKGRNTLITN